jgi:phosphate transport system protein
MVQRVHFTKKLEELRLLLLRMASLAEVAVHNAVKAFLANESDLAESVIMGDNEINQLEDTIDKLTLELLAQDQPVARDLRFIIGAMRVTVNLERLGDEAVNLGHRALFLSTRPPLPFNQKMERLCDVAKKMLADALKAFVENDIRLAEEVIASDSQADELNMKLLRDYVNDMVSESRVVERAVHCIMAARHLERVGDLSTNIAEAVIFIVEGESVKHMKYKYRG